MSQQNTRLHNPIRRRLFLLVILNGSVALLLAGLLLFGYERIETRDSARRELSSQAAVVAEGTADALAFADDKATARTLNTLRSDPDIVQAAAWAADGRLLAVFSRDEGAPPPIRNSGAESVFDSGLTVVQTVRAEGREIGTVMLKASMTEADAHLRRYSGIVAAILLFSLALALLLSSRMQRTITRPLANLSAVARAVSIGKDYSARAEKLADDEIGFLVDSFNQMLSQIEMREHALRESEERYALAARGANDGLWDWKLASNEIYFSPRWNQMLGYEAAETWSKPEEWFNRIHKADRSRVKAEIAAHREGKTPELASEYRIRRREGDFIWVLTRGIAVRDSAGVPVRIAGSQTDITKGKVADPLTGLPNRLYFLDRLENAIDTSARTGAQFAVLFVDMDRFKLVNDSMGHAAGDALLTGVARRLCGSVGARENGPDGSRSMVARLGGDEFAILLTSSENAPGSVPEDASAVAERILTSLNNPFPIHGRQVFAGVSIGVALSSAGQTPEELLRCADTAMYQAKAAGKGRFAIFDEGMRAQAVARLEIETELRKAIEKEKLTLHFQPQISLETRQLTGFEALVRWKHGERGLIPPAEFIPVAEETGLIVPLGSWVLREACRQMAEWQKEFAFDPPLSVSVNVSFRQLSGMGFVEEVRSALRKSGLPPATLHLEMTESAVMKNPRESMETLRGLKDLGSGLEIDDFGTGYSSLGSLGSLPFDTVKVDRIFVSELGTRDESGDIVRAILELARSLRLNVIAEGVETETQLNKLRELGCTRGQGFYFSKPVPAESVRVLFDLERDRRSLSWLGRLGESGLLPGNGRPAPQERSALAAPPMAAPSMAAPPMTGSDITVSV